MIQLPEEIKQGVFTYYQVRRDTFKAMFARYKGDKLKNYEVFYIQVHYDIIDKEWFRKEVYPKEPDFGRTAWRFDREKQALRSYHKLTEKNKSK